MKLLLIEDEHLLIETIKHICSRTAICARLLQTSGRRLNKIDFYEYDCVIVDIGIPFGNGLDIVKELKAVKSKSGIIIISREGFHRGQDKRS